MTKIKSLRMPCVINKNTNLFQVTLPPRFTYFLGTAASFPGTSLALHVLIVTLFTQEELLGPRLRQLDKLVM